MLTVFVVFAAIIININFVSIEWIKKRVMNLSKMLRISSVRIFPHQRRRLSHYYPPSRKVSTLKITLVFDVVEDHSEQSADLALLRYFNSRLINFLDLHPEVTFFELRVLLLLIVFSVFEGAIYTILRVVYRILYDS